MTTDHFIELVEQALADLPDMIAQAMDNIELVIEMWPTYQQMVAAGLTPGRETLLGLYEGVPLTARTHNYGLVPPDKITIFQGPILALCQTDEQVREQVRRTVIHEIAHHFGISDKRLRELDRY